MVLILGVLVFFGGIAMIIAQIRIRARAETAEGEVVAIEEIKSWSSNSQSPGSGGTKILYRPTWIVRSGDAERRIQSTEASSSMNVPLGTRQKILIDPANPGTGQPAGLAQYVWGVGVAVAGIFVAATDWLGLWG